MTGTFFDRLGDELDAAARRPSRSAKTPLLLATAAAVLVVGVAVGVLGQGSPAAAGVEVEVRDDLVYLRLLDDEHDAEAIESAAADAGLDVDVEAVPVGPSLVGRFLSQELHGPLPGELRQLDEDGDSFTGFVLPVGFEGTVDLRVGRPPHEGEAYASFSNALSPGEPLACSDILRTAPAEAHPLVTDLQVTWQAIDGEERRLLTAADLDDEPWASYRVASALSTAPGRVVLVLTPDGRQPKEQQALTRPADC